MYVSSRNTSSDSAGQGSAGQGRTGQGRYMGMVKRGREKECKGVREGQQLLEKVFML